MFDFDQLIDRCPWNSTKWDKYQDQDVLPFWVADMDFATPDFLIDAIQRRLQHPVLGYSSVPLELDEAFIEWADRQFHWAIDPEWLVWVSAVVPGLNIAVRSIGSDGDQCLIPIPVYPPFLNVPEQNQRIPKHSHLIFDSTRWVMDFDDIRSQSKNSSSLLLCNPQNPTGRCYTDHELRTLANICLEHETILVSDEIHWGLVLDEKCSHIPVASISDDIAQNSITLLSHTKSYNIAGVQSAVAVIPNADLRAQYEYWVERLMGSGSPIAYAVSIAAYKDVGPWLSELQNYLRDNRDLVQKHVASMENIEMAHVEATHLAWMDARELPVVDPCKYFEAFGLGLSDGAEFGAPGFVRFNFAVPRTLLQRGLERLERACACATK